MDSTNTTGTITWGDGDNNGTVIGGGNNGPIFVGPGAAEPQPYDRGRVRLLPITELGLQIGSALATITTFITGYQSVGQIWGNWQSISHMDRVQSSSLWVYAFLGAMLVTATLLALLHAVHHRTHHYSRFSVLPGVAGVLDQRGMRRLALVRNRGTCMQCGGELRFYSRATQTHREYDPDARAWRTIVDAREPVAECV